jgi:hypothetical protein
VNQNLKHGDERAQVILLANRHINSASFIFEKNE